MNIPNSWKVELVSASHTFVAAFMVELGIHINEVSLNSLSSDLLKSILFAAIRSGVKALAIWIAESMKK